MKRLDRFISAIPHFSTRKRKVAEGLLAQLRDLLSKESPSEELAQVSCNILELMGQDVTKDRRLLADLNPQELLAAGQWYHKGYWNEEGGLFGQRVASSRELLLEVSNY